MEFLKAAARPWGNLALLAAATAFSGGAMAQAMNWVELSCPTPTSQGVTADLSTGGPWLIQPPGSVGWEFANPANHPDWQPAPGGSVWIGNGTSGSEGNYTATLSIEAFDPDINLTSAKLTYTYIADSRMVSANLGGTNLAVVAAPSNAPPVGPIGPVTTPLVAGVNTLTVVAHNDGGPYGMAMQATLTYNCGPTPSAGVAAVPVDAPWALLGLSGVLAAGAVLRRRKRG